MTAFQNYFATGLVGMTPAQIAQAAAENKSVLDSVEGTQKAFKLLESNAQAMTRSAERLQVTAEQTGKEIQATFAQVASKVKSLSGNLA